MMKSMCCHHKPLSTHRSTLEASAIERQLVLSWHSLRCANHPFGACALDSWQLSLTMENKYEKGSCSQSRPPKRNGLFRNDEEHVLSKSCGLSRSNGLSRNDEEHVLSPQTSGACLVS